MGPYKGVVGGAVGGVGECGHRRKFYILACGAHLLACLTRMCHPPSGLNMLSNIQKGHAHGEIAGWPLPRRRHFGVYLLYKAFRAFLLDTPPQIYQGDL